ncbi:MAG TPA: hypothetical protein VFN06_07685 [Gaiellaceae bacterium]|nr:hypothetical protein [Gaiellaceae bacterium]
MTRTISLITATVGAALLFALPAYGDNWGADRAQSSGSPELVDLLAAKNGTVDSSIFDKAQPVTNVTSPDWFERAAIAAQRDSQVYLDAADRVVEPQSIVALRLRSEGLNRINGLGEFATPYRDAADRVVQPQSLKALTARSEGLNRMYGLGDFAGQTGYIDANERAVPPVATPVTVTATGSDIEWPQVGIGLGMGIVLLFGLGLAMRAAHVRPFAH